ncbi:MAG: hypothetical protein R3E13_06585 [Alphaproteobacteria bacterium]
MSIDKIEKRLMMPKGQFNKTLEEPIEQLVSMLDASTNNLFSRPFFKTLSQGGLTQEQWKVYGTQFYINCQNFEKLLQTAFLNAQSSNLTSLAHELEVNLDDETGHAQNALSHETMRLNFFTALGLTKEELTSHNFSSILAGTKEHSAFIDRLVKNNNVYQQVGAFLVQEHLRNGLEYVKQGVEKSFPDAFLIDEGDSPDIVTRKKNAGMYINMHLECDAEEHFPNLLEAIKPLMKNYKIKKEILAGVNSMFRAEIQFFKSLENAFSLEAKANPAIAEQQKNQI